jgi:hypothetical protein
VRTSAVGYGNAGCSDRNAGSSDGWGARRSRTSCRNDREQVLFMPSWFAEWLPEDHLAWFVLAAVDEMDLAAFYAGRTCV